MNRVQVATHCQRELALDAASVSALWIGQREDPEKVELKKGGFLAQLGVNS